MPVLPARVRLLTVHPSEMLDASEAEQVAGIYKVTCGHCGAQMTAYDTRTGLLSLDRWTVGGGIWHPRRGHRERRSRRTATLAITYGSAIRGDHRLIALLPVSPENGWVSPTLPIVLECHRCRKTNGLDKADFPVE